MRQIKLLLELIIITLSKHFIIIFIQLAVVIVVEIIFIKLSIIRAFLIGVNRQLILLLTLVPTGDPTRMPL